VDELGECGGCGRTSLAPKRPERGKYRLRFIEVDLANFAAEAPVPAERGAAELFESLRPQEHAELERLDSPTCGISDAAASAIVAFPVSSARRKRP
jgi:hypothetical protein